MGIIAGATIGAGILLTFFFITLVFFLYRRRKGSEYGFHGPQPSLTVSRIPSRQGLRGTRGVAVHIPAKVGPETTYCKGWQKASRLPPPVPGRKDVTLRKLDIKVETVNREPLTVHSDREDDTASVSTATRVMKAIYSVRALLFPGPLLSSHSWDWPYLSSLITTVTLSTLSQLNLFLPHTHMSTHIPTCLHACTHADTHVHLYIHMHTPSLVLLQQKIDRWGLHRLSLSYPFAT